MKGEKSWKMREEIFQLGEHVFEKGNNFPKTIDNGGTPGFYIGIGY